MKRNHLRITCVLTALFLPSSLAQTVADRADAKMVNRIWEEGTTNSQAMHLQENFQVKPIFEEWMKPLQALGVTTIALRSTEGTDHLPFDYIGIPGFQFVQDPIDYIPQLHHTNQDVYDHCVPEDIVQSAIVMASFVYHAAMREEMLPRKPLSIPVEVK